MTNNNQTVNPNSNDSNQFTINNTSKETKRKEIICEVGFWTSILGFIGSFMGIRHFGLVIYVIILTSALQGFETKKKVKAILTLVFLIASVIVLLVNKK